MCVCGGRGWKWGGVDGGGKRGEEMLPRLLLAGPK